ncbi:hypothetical protein N7465_001191 [Penicillium sp. CMV-2018d]|nr:hypothetical protein N7465_001191 [Penicillium sp. CMV-2018d]
MCWVSIVIARYASTRQSPPAHVLWRVELRMLVLMREMLALQVQDDNDPLIEEVMEADSSDN